MIPLKKYLGTSERGSKPMFRSRFTSQIDTIVKEAWEEQEMIEWEYTICADQFHVGASSMTVL